MSTVLGVNTQKMLQKCRKVDSKHRLKHCTWNQAVLNHASDV